MVVIESLVYIIYIGTPFLEDTINFKKYSTAEQKIGRMVGTMFSTKFQQAPFKTKRNKHGGLIHLVNPNIMLLWSVCCLTMNTFFERTL